MDVDVRTTKKRFLAINRDRLRRVQDALRWRQRDFLELLPMFFHINHAMLPGFVSKDAPAGIPQYLPSKKSLESVKRIAKSFVYKKRAMQSYDIYAVFIMGSVGTIAQSDKSDFDIWICYNPELNKHQVADLSKKCEEIELWAANIGLEVHFFPMNADEFRRGKVHELSSESSGSTQHHLLLEEFYRTSVLVAGRYPLWWLVPPDEEKNYDEFAHQLTHKRFINSNEVIDFGGLNSIPAEEYFGAALWQVYKGIDSPYKSVLKILLMETYANEYPNSELLSMRYKRMVYEGVTNLNSLDPYFMLLHRLESYLQSRNEIDRLQLVRRCFYFKVNVPLSDIPPNNEDWQKEELWGLVKRWGWDKYELASLDNRNAWKVQRVLQERKLLVDELTHSYMFLSNFARKHAVLSTISQDDLNILGRKLYAAFERKAGKVELINRGISSNIVESKVVVQNIVGKESGGEGWNLVAEHNDGKSHQLVSLKKGRSVTELMTWCHFNQLISPGTIISLDAKVDILTVKEIKNILDALEHEFPTGKYFQATKSDFTQAPSIIGGCVFANVGLDPLPSHSRRGTDIISDKSDILNYSGFSFNLALSFDMVVITNWHEILTYRYDNVDGLINCICQYLWWHKYRDHLQKTNMSAFSFSSTHGIAIARRIEELFSDVVKAYYPKGKIRSVRYVVEVQQSYYILTTDNENFTFGSAENFQGLCEYLSKPQQKFVSIVADSRALTKTSLPKVFSKNKPGVIQLFYEVTLAKVNIYVLDENGSLFYQQLPFHDEHALLNQFSLFFNSVLSRQEYLTENSATNQQKKTIDYCSVSKKGAGKIQFERKLLNENSVHNRYFHVQVIGNVVNKKTIFTIYCEEHEFSSYEYGTNLFREVAKHVLGQRKSGEKYPIYITDLDLAPALLGDRPNSSVQIIEYLNYKKRIEEKLNREMQSL